MLQLIMPTSLLQYITQLQYITAPLTMLLQYTNLLPIDQLITNQLMMSLQSTNTNTPFQMNMLVLILAQTKLVMDTRHLVNTELFFQIAEPKL